MKRLLFILVLSLSANVLLFGQAADYGDDAFRYSELTQNGTARFRGLSGNQAALGGDASNIFGNPAGLAFYNRSEFSFSPSLNLINTKNSFLGTTSNATTNKPNIGQLGLVIAGNSNGSRRWRRTAFGISYSQTSNFNNYVDASGTNNNNRSSFVNSYIDAANSRNISGSALDQEYNVSTNQANSLEAAAYQLFLINGTETTNNNSGPPYYRFEPNLALNQRTTFESSGAHSQWTAAYAGNLDDKLYIGANIALTHLRYTSSSTITESPIGGLVFNNYSQTNQLTVSGNGVTLSVGAIYKIDPSFQLGATIASPTWNSVSETFQQSLSAIARDPNLPLNQNRIDVLPNDFDYTLQTPMRASGGFTYFIGSGKVGFLTATAEYVNYAGMRVSTNAFSSSQDNTDFRNDVTTYVKSTYQNVVNFRVGAEFRAGLLRIRGGAAYLPTAIKGNLDGIAQKDRDKLLLSGGLGVRNNRFFADIAGSFWTFKSGFTPYSLGNSANTPSVLTTNQRANLMLSAGVFF